MQGQPQVLHQQLLEFINDRNPILLYTVPTNTSVQWVIYLYLQKSDNASYTDPSKDDLSLYILRNWQPIPSNRASVQYVWYRIGEKDNRYQNYTIHPIYLNVWDRIYMQWYYCTCSFSFSWLVFANTVISAQNSYYTAVMPNISSQLTSIAGSSWSMADSLSTLASCLCSPPPSWP